MMAAELNRGERGERGGVPLASSRPGFVLGTIARSFSGALSQWSAGEAVKVWQENNGLCSVERITWTGSLVPCAHRCTNVPVELVLLPPSAASAAPAAVQKQ